MTAAIYTAEDKHHPIPNLPGLTAAERIVVGHWPPIDRAGMPTGLDKSVQVYADVRQGRWLVQCPWCSSAHYASSEDHRFFCTECSSGAVGGAWVPVVWPVDREEIEAALSRRPLPENRNWLVNETAADLWRENAENGVI